MTRSVINHRAARSIAARTLLSLALVAAIALVADSQSPSGVVENQAPVVRLPHPPVAGEHTRGANGAEFPQVGAAGDMIGFSHADDSGTQTITLVHTKKSWMAVYHIDKSGTLRLVSSRPIDADFSLQLNATSPRPEEIRQIGRR